MFCRSFTPRATLAIRFARNFPVRPPENALPLRRLRQSVKQPITILEIARLLVRFNHFVVAVWRTKEAESHRVKYWEIIADNLSKAGWSWGCVSALDREGRTVWLTDAHRGDGKRFVVHAEES